MLITEKGKSWRAVHLIEYLVVLLIFSGCASQQDIDVLQRQVWTNRRDLEKVTSQMAQLQKQLDEKLQEYDQRLETASQPLRKTQAQVGAQLDRMEVELGRLSGELEESAARSKRQEERINEIEQSQMTSMLEVQKGLAELRSQLNIVARSMGLAELVTPTPSQPERGGPAKLQPQTARPETRAAGHGVKSPEELYAESFRLFQGGNFEQARAGFRRYLEQYPHTDLADNAQFWLGECYYGEGKYREAITAYEKVIKQYPKSDKVSSALLKQSMAFLELGDKTAARILLRKIVKDYPKTDQAQIAQRKLAQLQ
ncbi:MAG: tol-pal system protein YbgF [Deltaproteobacteria bacterium]|nr:tol-pal system protein YbgF [Deltaproteobacteria bacterium]MBW2070102.1 tol-pal system protein YbgF [Deltaproteobacteria bacterium]